VITRRAVLASAAALCASPALGTSRGVTIIEAPSNLGLRPLRSNHEPGAWRGPEALRNAGLHRALGTTKAIQLPRPQYRFEAQRGTRIRNGLEIRRFSQTLGTAVTGVLDAGSFPLVVGGDCTVLLGCLLGAKSAGPVGLIHVDGHSDFYHPGNYDAQSRLGSAAGMDLALVTGRGEPLLASWNGQPLVEDAYVVQIGERDELDPDYDYRDIAATRIRRFPVRHVLRAGIDETVTRALASADGERRRLWVHIDLDVLDKSVMPAVDSPGSPGFDFAQLAALISRLLASGRIMGMDVAIYDPEFDPSGRYARAIVDCMSRALGPIRTKGVGIS
jgi:arginase